MPNKKTKKPAPAKGKVDNAFIVSQFYGFDGVELPEVEKEDIERAKTLRKDSKFIHDIMPPVEEPLAILRNYKDEATRENAQPILLYCEGQAKGSHNKKKPKPGEKNISLHVIGTPKSIAEAILIKTAMCILQEEGYKDLSVEINNIGGKDSMNQFFKELTAYYRKNLSNLNAECRQMFKEGTHALIMCKNKIKDEVLNEAPTPLSFLTEESRNHFKEVIEYLESQDIAFEINKDVLGDPHYSTNTVFTILDKKTGKILATGSRYDQLSKKSGLKKDIPSAGITIKINKPKQVPRSREMKSAKFFFIQIGLDAKRLGLKVLEELRNANIPVYQSLPNDRLSVQLKNAKKLKAPYILIVGQKEANDKTVLVKDANTHSQESVPLKDLVKHLKKMK